MKKIDKPLQVVCNSFISKNISCDEILLASENKKTPQKYNIYKLSGSFIGVFNKNYFDLYEQQYESYCVSYNVAKPDGYVEKVEESISIPVEINNKKDNHDLAAKYVLENRKNVKNIINVCYE